jgi:ribosomal protein S6
MRNYELFLLLGSKVDEAAAHKSLRDIEAVLNRYGGKFVKINGGSNIRLKYPIKNRSDAHQITVDIEAETQNLVEIKKQLNLVEEILRLDIFTPSKVAA